jgi:hypothetical protein
MIRIPVRLGLLALPALVACDLSAPVWSTDLFFPVDYPDVQLSDFSVAGQIPPLDVAFTTPPEQQDITGLLEELLSDDVNALTVEIITQSDVDVTATMTISIASSELALLDPNQSITIQLNAGPAVDTTIVDVNVDLLRGAIALYYQTDGSVRGAAGGTTVSPGDVIKIDVNLLANYQVKR